MRRIVDDFFKPVKPDIASWGDPLSMLDAPTETVTVTPLLVLGTSSKATMADTAEDAAAIIITGKVASVPTITMARDTLIALGMDTDAATARVLSTIKSYPNVTPPMPHGG